MAYTKTIWTNGATALSAENMNHIENGIAALDEGKVDKENGKGLSSNDYTSAEKTKLSGIETGAEVNQPAFGWIMADNSSMFATEETDRIKFVAGNNITLTPDTANKEIEISSTAVKISRKTATADNLTLEIPSGSKQSIEIPLGLSSSQQLVGVIGFAAMYNSQTLGPSQVDIPIVRQSYDSINGSLAIKVCNYSSSTIYISKFSVEITYTW